MKNVVKTQKMVNSQMNQVQEFKEEMHSLMLKTFQTLGNVIPSIFCLQDCQARLSIIPPEFINNADGNKSLSDIIENTCSSPSVQAMGLILQLKGFKTGNLDEVIERTGNDEAIYAIEENSGEISFTNLKITSQILITIFSTPEKTEIFSYSVNEKNEIAGQIDVDLWNIRGFDFITKHLVWKNQIAA
jgi:hypothetical protein